MVIYSPGFRGAGGKRVTSASTSEDGTTTSTFSSTPTGTTTTTSTSGGGTKTVVKGRKGNIISETFGAAPSVAAALTKTISASPPTKKSSSTSAAELYSARHSFVPEAKVKTFKDQSGRVVGVEDPFFRRSIAAPKTEYFDEKDLKKYERLNTAARIMSRGGSGIRKKKEFGRIDAAPKQGFFSRAWHFPEKYSEQKRQQPSVGFRERGREQATKMFVVHPLSYVKGFGGGAVGLFRPSTYTGAAKGIAAPFTGKYFPAVGAKLRAAPEIVIPEMAGYGKGFGLVSGKVLGLAIKSLPLKATYVTKHPRGFTLSRSTRQQQVWEAEVLRRWKGTRKPVSKPKTTKVVDVVSTQKQKIFDIPKTTYVQKTVTVKPTWLRGTPFKWGKASRKPGLAGVGTIKPWSPPKPPKLRSKPVHFKIKETGQMNFEGQQLRVERAGTGTVKFPVQKQAWTPGRIKMSFGAEKITPIVGLGKTPELFQHKFVGKVPKPAPYWRDIKGYSYVKPKYKISDVYGVRQVGIRPSTYSELNIPPPKIIKDVKLPKGIGGQQVIGKGKIEISKTIPKKLHPRILVHEKIHHLEEFGFGRKHRKKIFAETEEGGITVKSLEKKGYHRGDNLYSEKLAYGTEQIFFGAKPHPKTPYLERVPPASKTLTKDIYEQLTKPIVKTEFLYTKKVRVVTKRIRVPPHSRMGVDVVGEMVHKMGKPKGKIVSSSIIETERIPAPYTKKFGYTKKASKKAMPGLYKDKYDVKTMDDFREAGNLFTKTKKVKMSRHLKEPTSAEKVISRNLDPSSKSVVGIIFEQDIVGATKIGGVPIAGYSSLSKSLSSQLGKPISVVKPISIAKPISITKSFSAVKPISKVQPISKIKTISAVRPISVVRPISTVRPISAVRPISVVRPISKVRAIQSLKPISKFPIFSEPAPVKFPGAFVLPRKTTKTKRGQKFKLPKPKTKYKPSLKAALFIITAPKIPKTITGIGTRPIVGAIA